MKERFVDSFYAYVFSLSVFIFLTIEFCNNVKFAVKIERRKWLKIIYTKFIVISDNTIKPRMFKRTWIHNKLWLIK